MSMSLAVKRRKETLSGKQTWRKEDEQKKRKKENKINRSKKK